MPPNFLHVNSEKIGELSIKFAAYPNINRTKIECWLNNFDEEHKELALKLLDYVDYYDNTRILNACRNILTQVKSLKNNDLSNVFFVGLGSAGKSGSAMLTTFRSANSLSGTTHNSKFLHMSELNNLYDKENISIVFIDDFIGTGDQFLSYYKEIGELIPQNADITLAIVCGFRRSIDKIQTETEVRVLTSHYLEESDRLFSRENTHFTNDEKAILKTYCDKTGSQDPYGYSDSQAKVVFHYRTPSNTVSILGVNKQSWRGLFPRYPFNN